jgi:hypothetical protein
MDARRYLLGDADEDAIAAFEVRLLAEPHLVEELEAAEEQLIDEYVRGSLSDHERSLLHRNFLTPERRRQIELTGFLLNEGSARESDASAAEPQPLSRRDVTVPSDPRRRAIPAWALTAAASIVVGALTAWIASGVVRNQADRTLQAMQADYDRERELRTQELAAQRAEVTRLTQQMQLSEAMGGPLLPVDSGVRSTEPAVLTIPPDAPVVRLAFDVPPGRHAAYRVSILARDGAGFREVWTADVPGISDGDGRIRAIVAVPRGALTSGAYLAQVSGRIPDSTDAAEFALRVP